MLDATDVVPGIGLFNHASEAEEDGLGGIPIAEPQQATSQVLSFLSTERSRSDRSEVDSALTELDVSEASARSRPRAHRRFELIVFDLDGVVIDSVADIIAAARHCLQRFGNQDRDAAFIRSCIGGGARTLLLRCMDEDKKEHIDDALKLFKSYYEDHCTRHTVLFPGVLDVLGHFSGKKKMALATFKIRSATLKILTELKVIDYFDVIVTADDVRKPKPDPECVHFILQKLGCPREAAIMVGDTRTDILTAKNAGIATCAVTYGIGTPEELEACEPDYTVGTIGELKNIVVV